MEHLDLPEVNFTCNDGMVLLRLYVPPGYYRASLIFDAEGRPIGVLSEEFTNVLLKCRGTSLKDLLRGKDAKEAEIVLDSLIALWEAGLVFAGDARPVIYEIDPGAGESTRQNGEGVRRFVKYFYDYFGGVFKRGSPLIDSNDSFLPIVEPFFPSEPGLTCLDAGAGSGYYSAALASRGHRVYACDICAASLRECARQPCGAGEVVPVECRLEDIPVPSGSIDFIMCNFVLEHVADPELIIDEFSRLLRPGGTVFVAVPSLNLRDTIAAWVQGEQPTLNFEHFRSYGLIPKTHPWCEPTLDTLAYLQSRGLTPLTIQSVNIESGLQEPWLGLVNAYRSTLGTAMNFTWPWNMLGQQTLILSRKVA